MAVPRTAVSEREACRRLGDIDRKTLYTLRINGEIGFYRVSNRRIVYDPVKHIDAYLKKCERNREIV